MGSTMIHTRAYVRLLGALAMALMMAVAVAGPASATHIPGHPKPNSVNNSGYSNQAILICSPGDPCVRREPGGTMYQSTDGGWNPDAVAVCAYCVAKYRAIAPSGYATGWVEQHGSRYPGNWIDTAALFRMWGQGTQVQVIMAGPFY